MTENITALVKREVNELTTDEVLDMFYQLQAIEEQIEIYKHKLMPVMRKYYERTGNSSVDNDYIRVTYVKGHEEKRFSVKALKEKFPEVYKMFLEDGYVKESVRVKVK